jgi:hypothetical protein
VSEVRRNNVQEFGPYHKENTALHHYKDQLVGAVYSENTKPQTMFGQNAGFVIVNAGGTYSYR